MIIGVPKEIKPQENRVALVPGAARTLVAQGHRVVVERSAGAGSGFPDEAYSEAGAELLEGPEAVFGEATLILKVKEPLAPELKLLQAHHLLFTYLHLAPDPALTQALLETGCTAIAYETVSLPDGHLPLLAPMSQVAGRMAALVGANTLTRPGGGRGLLMGGIPGVRPAHVVVIGGGTVGSHAAQMAVGMGADVAVLDINAQVLERLDLAYRGALRTVYASPHALEDEVLRADLVVGAVLVAGARAPRLVTRAHLRQMTPGTVLVDVAIDQGGCFETSRPTTHAEPTYVEEGIVHYCVANMPGAVPRTSTLGLTNTTLPYVRKLADHGVDALAHDPALALGLNVSDGKVRHPAVAETLDAPYEPLYGAHGG